MDMRVLQVPIQGYGDLTNRLTEWVTTFEDVLHIISGPFLAIGALIATSFIFTDGAIGRAGMVGTSLIVFWSITQAVGLDFQVLSLGYRSITAARAGKWGAFTGMVLLAAVLGFVGVQTHAIFGYVSSNGSSINVALHAMGIDQRILLWERAGLSFLLTFISGALRPARREIPIMPEEISQTALQALQTQIATLGQKIAVLPEATANSVPAPAVSTEMLQEMLDRMETISTKVDQMKQAPASLPGWEAGHWANADLGNTGPNLFTQPLQSENTGELQDFASTGPLSAVDKGLQINRGPQIRELLAQEPGLSTTMIARRIGCSNSTASIWKKRIEAEMSEKAAEEA
jgi:hypothetical protein